MRTPSITQIGTITQKVTLTKIVTHFLPHDNVTTMSEYGILSKIIKIEIFIISEEKSGVRPREVGLRFLGSTRRALLYE